MSSTEGPWNICFLVANRRQDCAALKDTPCLFQPYDGPADLLGSLCEGRWVASACKALQNRFLPKL